MPKTQNLYPFFSPFGLRYLLFIRKEFYPNGSIRIQLYDSTDGSPYATATSLTQERLEEGEVGIKNWSENEGILEFLVSNSIIESPHRYINQGYVRVPICRLKDF